MILKGGTLVAATVGLDNRSTMDVDTTLINLPLNEESTVLADFWKSYQRKFDYAADVLWADAIDSVR